MRSNSRCEASHSPFWKRACISTKRVRATGSPDCGILPPLFGSKPARLPGQAAHATTSSRLIAARIVRGIVYSTRMKKQSDPPPAMDALSAHLDRGWDLLKKNDLRGAEISA